MREHLGYAFFFFFWVVFFRNFQHVAVEVWNCNSVWTTDSQQYVLKSCTIAKRVFYPGTRTLFFCTAGPIPETLSFIVNLLFKLCFSHLKKIFLWHNLPQIHSKLYICFPIKKITIKKNKGSSCHIFKNWKGTSEINFNSVLYLTNPSKI